jgi:5,10-methenyltetrahydromethanopterin hydrogenase
VTIPTQLQGKTYELINSMGQVVYSGVASSRISISELDAGVYFLSVMTDEALFNATVLKK